jgi:hypothetical protein
MSVSEDQRDDSAKVIEFPKERIVRENQKKEDDEEAKQLLIEISARILAFLGGRRGR